MSAPLVFPAYPHCTCAHAHQSINNIACRLFRFPNPHAMTSEALTYSQCYRAACIKSDWQPVTWSSIPNMLPCWGKQLEDHNIFEWSLMSVQSWGSKRISLIMLEPINAVAQFRSGWIFLKSFKHRKHLWISSVSTYQMLRHTDWDLVFGSLCSSDIMSLDSMCTSQHILRCASQRQNSIKNVLTFTRWTNSTKIGNLLKQILHFHSRFLL